MNALRVLVRIRLAEIIRRPSGAFWFFALPIILLGLLAGLFANGHPFERHHVAVVGTAPALESDVVFDTVLDESAARARLDSRAASAVLIGDRVLVGPREELFGRGLAAAIHGRVEVIAIPENGYVRFLVPGVLAQGVVVAGLFGMGYAMVRYRQSRFLRKLATTPLSRSAFVLSQILARTVLVSIQLLLMLAVARFALGVPISIDAIGWTLLVGALGLVTFMGIGFCVSVVVETESNVVDIINALSVPVALLSEIFFSDSELPRAIGFVSAILPSTAMVRSFRAVLLHHDDALVTVLPNLGILVVWALVTYGIAVRTFKWR
jgi:ABC-type multidrug transport system permease subunit